MAALWPMMFAVIFQRAFAGETNCHGSLGTCPGKVDAGNARMQALGLDKEQFPLQGDKLLQVEAKHLSAHGELINSGTAQVEAYVDRLAVEVAGHNYSMSPAETSALQTIKVLIDKMLVDAVAQHAEDQAEVTRMRDLIRACSADANTSLGSVAGYKSAAGAAGTAHATCRTSEGTANGSMRVACATYNSFRQSSSPPGCLSKLTHSYVSTEDAKEKVDMETCLSAAHAWLPPLYDKYADCELKKEAYSNKTSDCDSQQSSFEESFCLYALKLDDACDSQNACRSRTIIAFNDTRSSVQISESARKTDVEAGSRIKCLFNVMETNNTQKEHTLKKCRGLQVNTSKFDITYHSIPAGMTCVQEQDRPGSAGWTVKQYTSRPWYGAAKARSLRACTKPTTTTTTSQASCGKVPDTYLVRASAPKLKVNSKTGSSWNYRSIPTGPYTVFAIWKTPAESGGHKTLVGTHYSNYFGVGMQNFCGYHTPQNYCYGGGPLANNASSQGCSGTDLYGSKWVQGCGATALHQKELRKSHCPYITVEAHAPNPGGYRNYYHGGGSTICMKGMYNNDKGHLCKSDKSLYCHAIAFRIGPDLGTYLQVDDNIERNATPVKKEYAAWGSIAGKNTWQLKEEFEELIFYREELADGTISDILCNLSERYIHKA